MDLLDETPPGSNQPEFTVSELSGQIKRLIEGEFGDVRVRGEIGRVTRARSGHLYFDLKDDRAVLSAVCWKGQAARLTAQPEEGLEMVAVGRMTTFPGQSRYQLVVEDLRVAGVGALMAMLEKRKKALAAEGLFDAERKRALPYLPRVIGVITSPSGAVIRDILHRLRDRFPVTVLLWPVAVQGEQCPREVARAIEGFNRLEPGGEIPRPDLLIVARGGGSIEDLWGFNDEAVVRAAAASKIPLISAVGHETDWTLIDLAADYRAPTPTGAAEKSVPVRSEIEAALAALEDRRRRAIRALLDRRAERLRDLSRGLPRPEEILGLQAQRLDSLAARLPAALVARVQRARAELARAGAGLRPRVLRALVTSGQERLDGLARRADRAAAALLQERRARLAGHAARLRPDLPARLAAERRAEFDRLARTFDRAAAEQLRARRERLAGLERLLETLSYRATLERGFAVVRDEEGRLVPEAAQARKAQRLEIEFRDGKIAAAPLRPGAGPRAPRKGPGGQGELF